MALPCQSTRGALLNSLFLSEFIKREVLLEQIGSRSDLVRFAVDKLESFK